MSRHRNLFGVAFVTLALCGMASCAGLETGNGQDPVPPEGGEVTLKLALTAWDVPFEATDAKGLTITLAEASLSVEEIRLELLKDQELVDCESIALGAPELAIDCGKSNRLDIDTIVEADLLTETWTPVLAVFRIPQAAVKKVRVYANAATVAGSVIVEGTTHNVLVQVAMSEAITFEAEKDLQVEPDVALDLTLEVDVQSIFEDVDLAACVQEHSASGANPLVLDTGKACAGIGAKVAKAIKGSALLR